MAYGTKYIGNFSVQEGVSRTLANYVVEFKKNGYVGLPLYIVMGGNALSENISNPSNSFIGIKEKTLSIGFVTDFDLSELLVADLTDWKVSVFKTVGTSNYDIFSGFLLPSKSATDYEDGAINVRLEATDGLSFLKKIDFVDDNSVYYEGLESIFDIIRKCLLKIGTGLKINIINNTYEVSNNKGEADEALKQNFLDLDLYRGENEPLNTYDVLSKIITTQKLRLFQEDNEWWIENVAEKATGYVSHRKYSISGTQISYGTINLGIDAVHGSDYQPLGGGSVSNVRPVKWVKVEHKLGKFKNQLLNRDFRVWNNTDFASWTRNGTAVTRVGDGTSGNPYGVKIPGFVTKSKNAKSIFQTIVIGSAAGGTAGVALQKNIVFSGSAYTQDIELAVVRCYLQIVTFDYGVFLYGLNDAGEWVRNGAEIALKNADVNNHSKKTAVTWNVTSKRVGDVKPFSPTGALISWETNINRIEVIAHLMQGVGQLTPYPGETQDSNVWYKNINLGWVNADTNLNLREVNYKAIHPKYASLDDTYEASYGDYLDGGNLSAIKKADGTVTSLWTSANYPTAVNFHNIGAKDILHELGTTQKVYDGTVWGLVKYRHSLRMTGFTNRGYIVSYKFDYATTQAEIRMVEHQDVHDISVKKTGLLSDGTEIDMVGETVPSPISGNGVGGGSVFDINTWLKQIMGGIQGTNADGDPIIVGWNGSLEGDVFDFGTVVKRDGKLAIGVYDSSITLGNPEFKGLVEVLGDLGIGKVKMYDRSTYNEDDSINVKSLGIDTDQFYVEGIMTAVGEIQAAGGAINIGKGVEGNADKIYIDAVDEELSIIGKTVNIEAVLAVSEIKAIGESVIINDNWIFNIAPYLGSIDPDNKLITKQEVATLIEDSACDCVEDFEVDVYGGGSVVQRGMYYEVEEGDKVGFFGLDKTNSNFILDLLKLDNESSTITTYRTVMMQEDGRLYRQINGEEAVKYLIEGEGVGISEYEVESLNGEGLVTILGSFYEVEEGDKFAFFGLDKTNGDFIMDMTVEDAESSTITKYRNYMSIEDGRWYYQINGEEPIKYLLSSEVSSGGGGGTTYTLSQPLYFVGNQINVRTASGSQKGVITAADWTIFNNKQDALGNASVNTTGKLTDTDWATFNGKIGNTDTVNDYLNFINEGIYFNKNANSNDSDAGIRMTQDGLQIYTKQLFDLLLVSNLTVKIKSLSGDNPPANTYPVELDIGHSNNQSVTVINGTSLNYYLPSAPTNGAKYVHQFDSSNNIFFLVPI